MAKELGETTDPKELVPGNPDAITTTLNAMRGYGDALHEAGTGLKRVKVADGWSGAAGDAKAQHDQSVQQAGHDLPFHDAASGTNTT